MALTLTTEQRLQSFALNRCRACDLIAPKRLLQHFTLETLVKSVATDPSRLHDIVVRVTGTRRKIVEKKTVEEALAMVGEALEVGAATPEDLFDESSMPAGINTDEIAFFFPPDQVFDLWFNAGWQIGGAKDDKTFMANIWEFILEHQMFGKTTPLEMVLALGLGHFVTDRMPHLLRTELLEAVFLDSEPLTRKATPDSSSTSSGGSKPFSAASLLKVITPEMLSEYVDLPIMARPIEALAKKHGWIKTVVIETTSESVPPPADDGTGKPRLSKRERKAAERAAKAAADEPETQISVEEGAVDESDVDDVPDDDTTEG